MQAYQPSKQLLDYAATKAAINNLTVNLAADLGPDGIRVNAVAPGPIWTPLQPATRPADYIETLGAHTPLGPRRATGRGRPGVRVPRLTGRRELRLRHRARRHRRRAGLLTRQGHRRDGPRRDVRLELRPLGRRLLPTGTPGPGAAGRVQVPVRDGRVKRQCFYRWPTDRTFAGCRRRLPAGFAMSVTARRGLTHAKRLYAPEAWVARMAGAWHELGDRRGVVLVQLWTEQLQRVRLRRGLGGYCPFVPADQQERKTARVGGVLIIVIAAFFVLVVIGLLLLFAV